MTVYLTVEQLVQINAENGGTVNDVDGLEACAHRPQSGSGDEDFFPDVWSKAAVYLHGIASTQYFSDANKRTAWYAAATFLRLNGYQLPDIETIDAETFVQAVAQKVFNTTEDQDLTVKKAAEWFRVKWETRRVGPCRDRRLEFMFLSRGIAPAGAAMVNLGHAFVRGIAAREFPCLVPFFVIGMLHWDQEDYGRDHLLTASLVDASSGEDVGKGASMTALGEFQAEPVMPMTFILPMRPMVPRPGDYNVVLEIDGKAAATLSLSFHDVKDLTVTDEGLSNLIGGSSA